MARYFTEIIGTDVYINTNHVKEDIEGGKRPRKKSVDEAVACWMEYSPKDS